MAYIDPRYLEQQRKRFTRHDAHLYIRHDAYRFAPPGSPRYSGKDVVRYFEPDASDNLGRTVERKHASPPVEPDWRDDPEVQRIVTEMKQDIRELLLHYKYDPNQPRVPVGNPGGGRWTRDGGLTEFGGAKKRSSGGFGQDVLNWTVRQFVSRRCKGYINRELPSQFEDTTIADLIEVARGGDAAARKCEKLLREPRFRK